MPTQTRTRFPAPIMLVLAAATGVFLSLPAHATLGGAAESVERDRVQIKAVTRVQAGPGYTVHAMTAPSGTAIREYAGSDGKVFAVTWSGPAMPNLRQLLGNYFSTYTTDPAAKRSGHAHRQLDRPELVVHSRGRQRSFSGKAYVPSMIPTGVAIDELQ
ncbi:MAG: DUF2844 domain-containing protein [Herminiimonas sp.]|nr:DUF2844 domain-containing protein [Herminiimonas sp.]